MKPQEYQALIAGGCPYCEGVLQIKRGKHGEFIACSNWCGYTKGIIGRSSFPTKTVRKPCRYNKCDGSSLIPLKNNKGNVVPYAWIDCECKEEARYYQDVEPGDFDFPCSDSFRAYYNGEQEYPRREATDFEDRVAELEDRTSQAGAIPKRYQYQLQQLTGRVLHFEGKVSKGEAPFTRITPQKTSYKGIK